MTFRETYTQELLKELSKYPEKYCYGPDAVPGVVSKMVNAFLRGNANKNSRAIRRSCIHLGIAYTYSAIKARIEKEESHADAPLCK
jgi:hypothetical protein